MFRWLITFQGKGQEGMKRFETEEEANREIAWLDRHHMDWSCYKMSRTGHFVYEYREGREAWKEARKSR